MLKSYKKIFFKGCKSRQKNFQNNVNKNTPYQTKTKNDVFESSNYNNNVISNELNASSVNSDKVTNEPKKMLLCDQNIVDNAELSENLEFNQVQSIIDDTKIN